MTAGVRLWAVVDKRGGAWPWSVRYTRREAIRAFCDNGPDDDPDDWEDWQKKGHRCIRVRVTIEDPT